MSELEKQDEFQDALEESENCERSCKVAVEKFYAAAEHFERDGKTYWAAESYRKAAMQLLKSVSLSKGNLGQPTDEGNIRAIANYFKDAGRLFHAAGKYVDAARVVASAAELYREQLYDYKQAYMAFALSKDYFGDAGDYAECGKMYYKEMECKRLYYRRMIRKKNRISERFSAIFKFGLYQIFKSLSVYGESLSRLLGFAAFTTCVFTIYYFWGTGVVLPGNDIHNEFYVDPSHTWYYLAACFNFSLSLFAGFSTTPYLLYKVNLMSSLEAILGNLFMALLITTLFRKVTRR